MTWSKYYLHTIEAFAFSWLLEPYSLWSRTQVTEKNNFFGKQRTLAATGISEWFYRKNVKGATEVEENESSSFYHHRKSETDETKNTVPTLQEEEVQSIVNLI